MNVKKSKWLVVLVAVAMLATVGSAQTNGFNGDDCGECGPYTTPLIAGQNMEVGSVTVTNDDEKICVTYVLNGGALAEGWLIYETHLAIATEYDGIPQTSGNRWGTNPIPGLFPYGDDELDGVEEWSICIGLDEIDEDWEWGDCLYIAAHAVVKRVVDTVCDTIVFESEVGTSVYGPIYEAPDASTTWGVEGSAVRTYNWMGYTRNLTESDQIPGCTTNPSQSPKWNWGFGNDFNLTYNPDIDDVIWISTAPNTEVWHIDSWRKFVQEFDVPGTPVSGSLQVNADNYYVVSNGGVIGSDSNIWDGPETYNFTPVAGPNSLEFIVENFAQGNAGNYCDQLQNPNGLTFKGTVNYCYDEWEDETAWGEGERFNTRGNWGMYFKYKLCEPEPEPWIIYGIEFGGSGLYEISIDVNDENGTVAEELLFGTNRTTNNGLAFDRENQRLYYAAGSNLYFYDLETEAEINAGSFPSGHVVFGACFGMGSYWYINNQTDDLYRVDFDGNGIIASIDSNTHQGIAGGKEFGMGDIAMDKEETGIIYGSTSATYEDTEFFTYNVLTNEYEMITDETDTDAAVNLQIAFGLDGVLYGTVARQSTWYVVDIEQGTRDLFYTGTRQFSDLARGQYQD